jgi:hypothetical protein
MSRKDADDKPDPLQMTLRGAAEAADTPEARAWLAALLERGESAAGGTAGGRRRAGAEASAAAAG